MKKRSGILIGMILLMLSVIPSALSAALSEEEPYIASIEKNNEVVFFADHNESQTEGNWILLSGGKAIRLPEPFTFTYNGTNRLELEGADLELNVENYTDYLITYPYSIHSFYTVNESVEMDFNGSSAFKNQETEIYLVDMRDTGLSSVYDAFKAIKEENPDSFKGIFNDTVGSYTQVGAVTLDENGDIPATLDLGPQPAGLHGILVLLNDSGEKRILSMTGFEVLDYDLEVESPETLNEGDNLDISMTISGADGDGNFTYGAFLVKESAYYADIRLNSNGTWAGTDILINGIEIIEEFDINSSNLESKLGRNELKTEIQTLVGEGNGTITIGEENESTLSLTAFDLPAGDYLLFAGAFEEGNGLVGIAQKELTITGARTSMYSSLDSGLDSSSSASSSSFSSESKSSASSSIEAAPETEAPEESSVKASQTLTEEAKPASPENGVAAEARKNSIPKGISFLAGFAGVIMLGMAVMNRRRI